VRRKEQQQSEDEETAITHRWVRSAGAELRNGSATDEPVRPGDEDALAIKVEHRVPSGRECPQWVSD
jgi:hypothetical protein